MDNANDKKLSFPQRNWFLLCVLVAILSPLIVHFIQRGAQKESVRESTDIHATASPGNDTGYKVATPPGTDSSQKGK